MKRLVITATVLLLFTAAYSQEIKKIYISRPKRADASLIKFRLLVNDQRLVMTNNSYAELELKADSVRIEVADSPSWMKTGRSVVTRDSVAYFSVFAHYPGGMRKEVIVIDTLTKNYYMENKKLAKRKVEPAQ